MVSKYHGGRIQRPTDPTLQHPDEDPARRHSDRIAKEIESYKSHMGLGQSFPMTFPVTFGPFVINAAIGNILEIANQGNIMVEVTAPWKLAAEGSSHSKAKLNSALYGLAESLRLIAVLISPVLPKTAHGIFDQLNWKMELSGKEERFSLADAEWGRLSDGHVVGKPVPLFPRIDVSEGV